MAEYKQRIVSCPQGHYFDANKYDSCPTCGGMGIGTPIVGRGDDAGSFSSTVAPGAGGDSYGIGGGGSFEKTQAPNAGSFGSTGAPGFGGGSFEKTQAPGMGSFDPTLPPDGHGQRIPAGPPASGNLGYFSPTVSPKRTSPGQFPETIAVDENTPVGQTSPVVGWLVAISGPCRGTDYRIHSNYNFIGREVGDIRVHGDQAISAERDSSIAYVAKTKRFYIAHEMGLNTVLVNDEPVMGGGRELANYDVITIGSTQLLFVALCGERFDWSNGVMRPNE